jgi:two-component system response regulator DegU
MKILIVDDNARFRALARALLAAVSEDMDECEDGADALALYERMLPDVVLMDIRMPRMDGLAATRSIVAQHPAAKIVIVSSYDDESLRRAAREAGACGYALKEDLSALMPMIKAADQGRVRPPQSSPEA